MEGGKFVTIMNVQNVQRIIIAMEINTVLDTAVYPEQLQDQIHIMTTQLQDHLIMTTQLQDHIDPHKPILVIQRVTLTRVHSHFQHCLMCQFHFQNCQL